MQLKKMETGALTTGYYDSPSVTDDESAVGMIFRAASLEGFRVDYIALRDTVRSSDDMNASLEFPPDTDAETVLDACRKDRYQRVFLSGKWQDAQIGLGIDLASYEIAITAGSADQDRISSLAGRLA